MNFNDFTLQRNMNFHDFLDLFRYQFWHWFLMSFGIDFGSILEAFCNYFYVFSVSFFASIFWSTFWWKIDQKWLRGNLPGVSLFRLFFDHTCTFYLRNTYKCQKTVFPTFLNKLKEFIHTCTFYLRNTYKCAITSLQF